MERAAQELKQRIIAENSEEFFNNLLQNRAKGFKELKEAADYTFGEASKEEFYDMVIEETLKANVDEGMDVQLYELVLTEMALDNFLNPKN